MSDVRHTDEFRDLFAQMMFASSNSSDIRLLTAFRDVAREDFLQPGPWTTIVNGKRIKTPSDNPAFVYQNVLIALDENKQINNGEPFLHARWLGGIAPLEGDTVVHVGAGSGYYTAILAKLVSPGGVVNAFEVDERLGMFARAKLKGFDNVTVNVENAMTSEISTSDIIYVNASTKAPLVNWLKTLSQRGRMIFPWRPTEKFGLAIVVRRHENGFALEPLMRSWFIPCVGAFDAIESIKAPNSYAEAASVRSLWFSADRQPDQSAVAVYSDVWLSSKPIS